MRQKSELFDVFKRLKVMVKNEIGMRVKKLWFDNGWEYEDFGFKNFFFMKMELN